MCIGKGSSQIPDKLHTRDFISQSQGRARNHDNPIIRPVKKRPVPCRDHSSEPLPELPVTGSVKGHNQIGKKPGIMTRGDSTKGFRNGNYDFSPCRAERIYNGQEFIPQEIQILDAFLKVILITKADRAKSHHPCMLSRQVQEA